MNAKHCSTRVHCATCLTDAAWRKRVGAPNTCPYGVRINAIPEPIVPKRKAFTPTPEQLSLIAARKAICESCEHNKGFTLRTVKCADCGCSGVSLISGNCKLGKWSEQ